LPVPAGQAKLWQPRKRRLAQIRVLCESAVLSGITAVEARRLATCGKERLCRPAVRKASGFPTVASPVRQSTDTLSFGERAGVRGRLAQIRVLCESAVLSERLSLSAQPSGEAAGGELQMTA